MHAEVARQIGRKVLPVESVDFVTEAARTLRDSVSAGEITERDAEAALDAAVEEHLATVAKTSGIDPESGDPLMAEAHEGAIRLAQEVLTRGDLLLLSEAITQYLSQVEPNITKAGYSAKERALSAFKKWLRSDVDVATITRRVAGRYVSEQIIPTDHAPKTKKDTIASLSAFGSWLETAHGCESNPWRNMSSLIRESSRGGKPEPRPYTPEEIKKLIPKLPEGDPMLPMACISAYSGMRLEEIASVKLEHLAKDAIRVMEGKNPNSVRYVPLHPVIRPMVARLKETSRDEYLTSGLLPGGADGKRSHYVSKRFGYWLRSNGFTDETLTFHSFRRSFAQRCEHAKIAESTAKLLMGHARQSLTFGLYSPGPEFPVLLKELRKVTYGASVDVLVEKLAKVIEIKRTSTRRQRTASRAGSVD
jgi:integrase